MSVTSHDQRHEDAPPRKPLPIGIVEIALGAFLIYLAYAVFVAEEQRAARAHVDATAMAATYQ